MSALNLPDASARGSGASFFIAGDLLCWWRGLHAIFSNRTRASKSGRSKSEGCFYHPASVEILELFEDLFSNLMTVQTLKGHESPSQWFQRDWVNFHVRMERGMHEKNDGIAVDLEISHKIMMNWRLSVNRSPSGLFVQWLEGRINKCRIFHDS